MQSELTYSFAVAKEHVKGKSKEKIVLFLKFWRDGFGPHLAALGVYPWSTLKTVRVP